MNRKLTDQQIVATFRDLSAHSKRVSGRALRAALRQEFGVAGKTDRIFALYRALKAPPSAQPADVLELRERIAEKDQLLTAALSRAERSEAREVAHQDRWANEIHNLRQTVEQLKSEAVRRKELEAQVLLLHRELQELRGRLARLGIQTPHTEA
ncbi:MAG: hypothetical protein ABSF96_08620 [Steroidobacteraceae bacterium]|jgi:hypothetical protein